MAQKRQDEKSDPYIALHKGILVRFFLWYIKNRWGIYSLLTAMRLLLIYDSPVVSQLNRSGLYVMYCLLFLYQRTQCFFDSKWRGAWWC
jgi:hypothetical protein